MMLEMLSLARRLRGCAGGVRGSRLALWTVAGLLLQLGPAIARAEEAPRPFLWKIQGESVSYLFGTIHLADDRVLNLPASVQGALASADVVYTEVPMDGAAQREVLERSQLPVGSTLESVLPDDLYLRLDRYLEARGVLPALFDRLKIWTVAVTLPMLGRTDPERTPLDQWIAQRAQSRGQEMGSVETVAEQVAALDSMGRQAEVAMLRETLEQLEAAESNGSDPMEKILSIYLAGDEALLLEYSESFLGRDRPETERVREALLFRRNRAMADAIAKQLEERSEQVHFFAIGALHYPGERGIVALLRARGFAIERVGEASAPSGEAAARRPFTP